MMYRMPPHIVAGLGGADLSALGIPSEAEYLAAYCRRRGLDGMPNYDFYIAFNFFRLAAIFHGIKGRLLRGAAASAQARERVAVLPELMALAWAQPARAMQLSSLRGADFRHSRAGGRGRRRWTDSRPNSAASACHISDLRVSRMARAEFS
jgi:hypothetical protein